MSFNYLDEKREKTPFDELETNFIKKGKWTLKRLFDNIPFLKKRYQQAKITPDVLKSVDDFAKIPFMDKPDFLDSYPNKLLCVKQNEVVRMHCTSGTSGNCPTTGFYTKNDLDTWTYLCARNFTAMGMTKNDVFQNTTSAGLFTGGFGYSQGCTYLGAMLIPFGPGKTQKQIQFFKDFKVTAFHAIPSFALHLGEVMEQEGVQKEELYLKYAIIGAEGWAESTRTTIQDKLGLKAHDNYGMTEAGGPGVAVECPEQNGMHIWTDYFYPEIVDPQTGELLGEGETGELVLTSLWKEASPIFRYRTGDITALHRSECACGRTGYIIDRIKGRKDDMHIIKGTNIYPSQVEEEVFKMSDIFTDQYLLLFHTVGVFDQMTLHVEVRPGIDKVKAGQELEKALENATMMHINIVTFDPGTLPEQEGKVVRWKDIRDRPDGYKGWLNMLMENKQI